MYLWSLVGHDPLADPIVTGISGDLAKIMRETEPTLQDGRAFIAIIEEAVLRVGVAALEETYVATGRIWHGRRTRSGGVHWEAMTRLPDAAAIYRIPGSLDSGIAVQPSDGEGRGDRAGTETRPDGCSPSGHTPR